MNETITIIPSAGRIVHFVLPNSEHRPALIVRVWDNSPSAASLVQLQVFVDGSNDEGQILAHEARTQPYPISVWRTSIHQDAENCKPGTWHAPELTNRPTPSALVPLSRAASELCHAIEKLPASEQQTALSVQAANPANQLRKVAGL